MTDLAPVLGVLAALVGIAADLLAAATMGPRTYRDPYSKTLSSFALASVSGALATGTVASADPALLLYPAYFCLVNAAIAILIHRRRRRPSGVRAVLARADARV